MPITIKELNLKTALYDKTVAVSSSFQMEHNGVFYNVSVRPGQEGISIHVSDGGRAICVFPQAANSLVIKAAEYTK